MCDSILNMCVPKVIELRHINNMKNIQNLKLWKTFKN